MYLARAGSLFLSFPVRLYVCSRACARARSLSLWMYSVRVRMLSLSLLSVSLSFFVRACWPTSQS